MSGAEQQRSSDPVTCSASRSRLSYTSRVRDATWSVDGTVYVSNSSYARKRLYRERREVETRQSTEGITIVTVITSWWTG